MKSGLNVLWMENNLPTKPTFHTRFSSSMNLPSYC